MSNWSIENYMKHIVKTLNTKLMWAQNAFYFVDE